MILFFLISLSQFCNVFSEEFCTKGVCYSYNTSQNSPYLTYDEALKNCQSQGNTLAIGISSVTQNLIKNETNMNNITGEFYIGLKYIPNDRFIWEDDSDYIPNLKWNSSIDSSQKACVFMTDDGYMALSPCTTKRKFICSNYTRRQTKEIAKKGICPRGFFQFLNNCYKLNLKCSDRTYTWYEANNECLNSGSSLLLIDSFKEQEFITALMTISPQPAWTGIVHRNITKSLSIWVNNATYTMPNYSIRFNKGEPNGFLSGNEHCLMIYNRLSNIGYFNDENCTKSMNIMCKTGIIEDTVKPNSIPKTSNPLFNRGKCNESYYEFNETCYSMQSLNKSYQESFIYCNHRVLEVYNVVHIAFIRSLMSFLGVEDVWLSIFGSRGELNGAHWLLKETSSDVVNLGTDKFYYMTTQMGLGTAKSSSVPNIATSCYYYLPSHEDVSQEYSCPLKWMKVGLKCLKVVQDLQNYSNAASQCKSLNGALATLKSMKEVEAVNSVLMADAWFGIDGNSYLKNKWLDGSDIDYCLFRHTADLVKIITDNPKNICFVIRARKSEWNDDTCESHHIFVCERPAQKDECKPNFPIHVDGDCYAAFDVEKTWSDAEKQCQKIGGNNSHLASFHSADQEHDVFDQIKNKDEHWIGLKMFDFQRMWLDGSIVNYQRNYNYLQISDSFTCFVSQKKDGNIFDLTSWSMINCGIKMKYICKVSSSKSAIIPKTVNITSNLFCPRDFIRFKNSCFKVVNEKSTWDEADKNCQSKFRSGNSRARLASFENKDELAFVLSHLRNYSYFIWIGLYKDAKTNQLVWLDEKPLTFIDIYEFNFSEKDIILPGNQAAMYISSNPFKNGHWKLLNKMANIPYICRIDPQETSNQYVNENKEKCPSPFYTEYNGFCYYFNPTDLSFQDAYKVCESKKSELLVLSDTFEEQFVKSFLSDKNLKMNLIWMGFKVDSSDFMMMNWETPNKKPVYYTHWKDILQYENNNFYTDSDPQYNIHGCFLLNFTSDLSIYNKIDSLIINNAMIKSSCDVRIPSVCKTPLKSTSDLPSESVTCLKSQNNVSYSIDVTKTKKGNPCIRWDLVKTENTFQYHLRTFLHSSLPYNQDGYLSYSLNRCSEYEEEHHVTKYSCYVFQNGKYLLEDCERQSCVFKKASSTTSNRTVLIVLFSITLFILSISVLFLFRKRILSNYRIRSFLAQSLGRYQPDWLADSHRPHTSATGGVGFTNPVYTPLESRY